MTCDLFPVWERLLVIVLVLHAVVTAYFLGRQSGRRAR